MDFPLSLSATVLSLSPVVLSRLPRTASISSFEFARQSPFLLHFLFGSRSDSVYRIVDDETEA